MKNRTSSLAGGWLTVGALIAIAIGIMYGWIMNIIIIANSNFSELTGLLILRVVGIFVAPLGVILGYV